MTSTQNGRDRRSKVLVGQGIAAAAIGLTIYGLVTLVVIGRSDFFLEGVVMLAVFAFGFGALAWLAIPRQPDNKAVWVPAWASLLVGISIAGWVTALLVTDVSGLDVSPASWSGLTPSEVPPAAAMSYALTSIGPVAGPFLMLTLWLLLFPDGRLPSPRWRWVAWGSVISMVAIIFLLGWLTRPASTVPYGASSADEAGAIGVIAEGLFLVLLGFSVICAGSLVIRHRRSTGDARQQYRWVGLGTGALFFAMLVVENSPGPLLAALIGVAICVASYGVAVTKHRLYDIDVVISRTFVYGILGAFIGAVYVLVVVVVGEFLGSEAGNLALAIVATALVAIAFEPVRRRAQRWANRLVYGKRATPYEVLSDLTRRLAGTEAAEGILSRMAQLMAEGTGAEQATVWLADRKGHLDAAAGWPEVPVKGQAESMDELTGFYSPVHHDEQLVGVLEVTKPRGNPVTPGEQHLMADLAGSTGLVLGNQRLNASLAARAAEVQQSRRRLVEVQDRERQHLERDLHDGAQQQVVALKLKIGLAEHLAERERADELAEQLGELAAEAQMAVDEIRTLAKGIYPPLLESDDLAAAIRGQAAAAPIPIEVQTGHLGVYPKDTESAIYFAAVEAISNAVRHGAPSHVRLSLGASEEWLELEVSDNGAGFGPEDQHEGTGLINVRDRIEALGGELRVDSVPGQGTTFLVRIPIDQLDEDHEEKSLRGADELAVGSVGGV